MRFKLDTSAPTAVVEKKASVLDQSPVVEELASSNKPSEVLSLPYSGVVVVIARSASMDLNRECSSCVLVSFSCFSICSGFSLLLIL